mgnify:CR=1 FL=1
MYIVLYTYNIGSKSRACIIQTKLLVIILNPNPVPFSLQRLKWIMFGLCQKDESKSFRLKPLRFYEVFELVLAVDLLHCDLTRFFSLKGSLSFHLSF